jgi:hypothetical protein
MWMRIVILLDLQGHFPSPRSYPQEVTDIRPGSKRRLALSEPGSATSYPDADGVFDHGPAESAVRAVEFYQAVVHKVVDRDRRQGRVLPAVVR